MPAMRVLVVSLVVLAFAGCGAPTTRPGPLYVGRADAEPGMECMPDPDVTDDTFTLHMRRGRELAQASFEIPDPEIPADHSAASLTAWSDGDLRAWLENKTHAVDAAREELDLAAEEDHRQRIIGGALVGLMFEDIARVLRSVPSPEDLSEEPEILEAFHHVIEGQARPYLETARQAYHACALNARRPETMTHWARFCRRRMDRLPEGLEGDVATDSTEVEVLVD
jgi:hypothetical protein